MNSKINASRKHLSNLLEAIERCVYFLDGSASKIAWPMQAEKLAAHNKDIDLFEQLSSVNERFSKLQDTLGGAMRHAAVLSGEKMDTFLQVLSFFEKINVLTSIEDWQTMRALRNLAAHEYEIDYTDIAEHFNSLKELMPQLYFIAAAFSAYCHEVHGIRSASNDYSADFVRIVVRV